MRKGTFARRIRPESLRFTPYVLRMCLAKRAKDLSPKLFTSFLGKMNHAEIPLPRGDYGGLCATGARGDGPRPGLTVRELVGHWHCSKDEQ